MTGVRHFTASAIVLDGSERVLLVHHRKAGVWLYPGGHIDSDEDPAQAAMREVVEETGVHAAIITESAFDHPAVTSHPVPFAIIEMDVSDSRVGAHRHIDMIYVARATTDSVSAQLAEVSAARWTPAADVLSLETPSELPALIERATRWAKART